MAYSYLLSTFFLPSLRLEVLSSSRIFPGLIWTEITVAYKAIVKTDTLVRLYPWFKVKTLWKVMKSHRKVLVYVFLGSFSQVLTGQFFLSAFVCVGVMFGPGASHLVTAGIWSNQHLTLNSTGPHRLKTVMEHVVHSNLPPSCGTGSRLLCQHNRPEN